MITITNKQLPPLKHPWKFCIGAGRAYDLLRADLLDHLKILQKEIGYRYIRFHGLFHDDMDVVKKTSDGKIVYQWHHIDKVFDSLLAMGLKPFVELNPMPAEIASGTKTIFYYRMNVTPPRDYALWENLIHHFITYIYDRYGAEEVRSWFFEVWNEPNLDGFWDGTQQDYFRLYAASAKAIKNIDPLLRVGGPATSKASWLIEMVDFCEKEQIPLDFITSHLYPQDEYVDYPKGEGSPHQPGCYFSDKIAAARRNVDDRLGKSIDVYWTEWNTLSASPNIPVKWTENTYTDKQYAAPLLLTYCMRLDSVLQGMSWWVGSDIFEETPMPDSLFGQGAGYGLLTILGTPKASFNAFYFLNKMNGTRLEIALDAEADAPNRYCLAVRTPGSIRILLWHLEPLEEEGAYSDWSSSIDLSIIDSLLLQDKVENETLYRVVSGSITTEQGSGYEVWQHAGEPLNCSRTEMAAFTARSLPAYQFTLQNAKTEYPFTLKPNEVLYLEISPAGPRAGTPIKNKNINKWDVQMSEQSK
jgi:xylan 1,4-beta-xylosidase